MRGTENWESLTRMCSGPAQVPATYLLVSLQLLEESALMEQPLQPVLGIVVAQLLEGGSAG